MKQKSPIKFSRGLLAVICLMSLFMVATLMVSTIGNGSTAAAATATVSITKSGGWLESAYAEWSPVTGATGYNVYCKPANASDSQYTRIDASLVRQYSTRYRADVLGLSAGNYVIRIVPVSNGAEMASAAGVSQSLTVRAHTREGFAFSSQSPMKTGSGGYNDNGTVPSNAQIIYITSQSANTVTLDVITSSKGTKTTCTGLVNILSARQKGYDKTPLIIRFIGMIKGSEISGLNSSGYIQVKGCYNVTLEGVGEDATAYQWGMLVRSAHNVEIRNLGFMLFPDDGISLDTDNENIWVHNNDIFYGAPGSDADQVKGDGSCDVKGFSDYVTVSYNHFWDSGKASLCGMSDTKEFHVTYHHNWFDHSDSRHPRIRKGTVHIYNNYFDGVSKYGVGNTNGGSAFIEANYFRNCKYPMLISLQGTDIYGGSQGTFSSEPGGMNKAFNNKVEGATRLVYHTSDSTQFDAYLASTRNEQVSSTYRTVGGGNTYNNFDTASTMYSYTPHSPDEARNMVITYAGRVNGGDFKWTFTTADDTDYGVNTALKTKIQNYRPDQQTASAPAAPNNLTASAGNAQVTLSWSASSDATSYNVKRATVSGGPYTTVRTGQTSTSYTDTGLTNGTRYYYVVSAVNSAGESGNSFEVNATPVAAVTVPSAPANLTATAGNAQISLSWSAVTGAASYNVKRSTTSGGSYTTIKTGLTSTSYTDTGLTNGTRYYYVVSAVNSAGESANSSAVNAIPAAPVVGLISNLTVNDTARASSWSIQSNLQVGAQQFGDRTFAITTLPSAYAGCDWIRTACDSKSYTGTTLVTFKVNEAVTVYVAHDDRITSKPSWLSGWSDTGDNIVDNESNKVTFSLFGKAFAAGSTVSLGPNGQSSGAVGYFVVVKRSGSLSAPSAPANLTATTGNAQISLSWSAVTGATSYNVKRSTASGGSYTTVKTGLTSTSYTDTGLTNGTRYYYVVSAVNSAGESSNSPQVNATPTAPASTSIFSDNFTNATTSNLFSAAYRALTSNSSMAMYYHLGGTVSVQSGAVVLNGGRFTIGNKTPTVSTTASDRSTTGELDLSRPYTISFKVTAVSGSTSKQLIVYVDNNTTSSSASIHGGNSKIYSSALSSLTAGQTVTIRSSVGSATSFIQIRTESSAVVTIDDLVITYQ